MENQPAADLWTNVDLAVTDAVRRLRRRSAGWWRDDAPGDPRLDRASRVAALVATLAGYDPAANGRTPPRPVRDETLVDQLRVVAYDLRTVGTDCSADPAEVAQQIRDCLRDVDPRP